MTTKHFINEPKSVVLDSLKGLVYANPSLALDVEQRVVYRSKIDSNKVHIITGGGSGHEVRDIAIHTIQCGHQGKIIASD